MEKSRKRVRLREYGYDQPGAYFVTICSRGREEIFGEVVGRELPVTRLSTIGMSIDKEIQDVSTRFENVFVDHYVIMPNHVHLIVRLSEQAGASPRPTVLDVICVIKSLACRNANKVDHTPGRKIWQDSFYEHVIRNERDYWEVVKYVQNNPGEWGEDEYYREPREQFVYVLQCGDGTFYCGWTTDLKARVRAHNAGRGAKYTKGRGPVELVYYEVFDSKSAAMRREYEIKQMSRAQKMRLIGGKAR